MFNEAEIANKISDTVLSAIDGKLENVVKKYIDNKLKNWKIPGTQIKANSIPSTGIQDGALLNGKYYEIQASIIKAFVLEAIAINAKLITTGQLDTSKVTIQSGENTRFVLNGDGLFAYFESSAGVTDETTYIVHDENGIRYVKEGVTLRSESWDGTKFFELVDGIAEESLIFTNDGKAFLKRSLTVGNNDSPEGAIKISGDENFIGTTKYASGPLGSGWRINGDGSATFNNIRARGTLTASTFEYDSISSVGGSLYVSASLTSLSNSPITIVDVGGVDYYSVALTFPFTGDNHFAAGQEWELNDILAVQGLVELTTDVCELRDFRCKISAFTETGCTLQSVDPISSIITYDESTRTPFESGEIDLSGGNITPNSAFIFIGSVGSNGEILRRGILISATDSQSPYIDIYDSTEGDTMPKVRLGNLGGINDETMPASPSGYGLYSTNAFLRGTIVANKALIGGLKTDAHTMTTIDGAVGIADGSSSSPAGDYVFWAGNSVVSEAPYRINKQGNLYIGKSNGDHLSYDGSNLEIQARSVTIKTESTTLALGSVIDSIVDDIDNLQTFKDQQQSLIYLDSSGVHVGKRDYLAQTIVSQDGLHIKDNTGAESAYFVDGKAYIQNIEVTSTWQLGNLQYKVYTSGRVALKKA